MQDPQVLPRRFPGVRRQISLFLVTAVCALIGAVLLVAYKQGAFVRHTKIYFFAEDVFGINKGMSVRLFGLPVGDVKNLEITDRGVRVELGIISEYAPRLTKGSSARLTREGYIGAANIQLVPGSDPKGSREPVSDGDVIGYAPARGVPELVEDIRAQLAPVVAELRRTLAELNRPDGDFRKSFASASALIQELPETNRDLRRFLRDADRTVLAVGGKADAALASTERLTTQAANELPALTRKLGTALDSIGEAAAEIRAATRKNGEALHQVLAQTPALVRDGGQLLYDSQEVIGAAKASWLIRDNLEPPAMRTLPMDSFESFGGGARASAAAARR
ncbi:MAG TPA: MlaD family protein [Burkholderiales bacterium]|jgi:phospholipid/cholesterol/gamma-HCH transport system substrate-binding protein|nr:MlaD family protein [Burkholderiales bacterium]